MFGHRMVGIVSHIGQMDLMSAAGLGVDIVDAGSCNGDHAQIGQSSQLRFAQPHLVDDGHLRVLQACEDCVRAGAIMLDQLMRKG